MDALWPFYLPSGTKRAFYRDQSIRKRSSDLSFLAIHCLITLGYLYKVEELYPLQTLLILCGSWIPALVYWALPKGAAARLRTPLFAVLKACKTGTLLNGLNNDYFPAEHPPQSWPKFVFNLLFTGQVAGYMAVGLGLQLPAAVDMLLFLVEAALRAAMVTPQQCNPEAAPPGMQLLAQLEKGKFAALADWLDFPFVLFSYARDALWLSDRGLCFAVYVWTQLVMIVLLPSAVLLISETRERRRFLSLLQQGGPAVGARRPSECGEPSASVFSVVPYLFFIGVMCWCVIRTVVVKLGL